MYLIINQNPNHFVRLYKATGYSIQGIKSTFQYEQAFRLEVYILVVLIPPRASGSCGKLLLRDDLKSEDELVAQFADIATPLIHRSLSK